MNANLTPEDITTLHQQYLATANDSDDLRLASVAEKLIQALGAAANLNLAELVLGEAPSAIDCLNAQTAAKNAAWLASGKEPAPVDDYFTLGDDGVRRVNERSLTALTDQLRTDLTIVKYLKKVVLLTRVPGVGVNVALKEALADITGEAPFVLEMGVETLGLDGNFNAATASAMSDAWAIMIDSPSQCNDRNQAAIAQILATRRVKTQANLFGLQSYPLRDDVLIVVSDPHHATAASLSFMGPLPSTIRMGRVYGKSL